MQGNVKFFDSTRGFGFISRAQGQDVFVHASNLHPDARGELADGQLVEFEVGNGRKGEEARNVRPI